MAEKYSAIRKKGVYIGHSSFPGDSRSLAVPLGQMMKHMFVAGRTGKGKTSIQARMMMSMMELMKKYPTEAAGFGFIDPVRIVSIQPA